MFPTIQSESFSTISHTLSRSPWFKNDSPPGDPHRDRVHPLIPNHFPIVHLTVVGPSSPDPSVAGVACAVHKPLVILGRKIPQESSVLIGSKRMHRNHLVDEQGIWGEWDWVIWRRASARSRLTCYHSAAIVALSQQREAAMDSTVCIGINADIYNEFVLRSGRSVDVGSWIEDIVQNYLDRTQYDEDIWCAEYLQRRAEMESDQVVAAYGAPNKGYLWQSLFLPNGTKLKMTYQKRDHMAEVKHQQILYEGAAYSPSEFARRVANNTSRNAWRDIWVKFPDSNEWQFADDLRRRQMA